MENNAENKTELKNRLINFYISHKKKIYCFTFNLINNPYFTYVLKI